MEPKNYKYNNEDMHITLNDVGDIQCKSCAFRMTDYVKNGKVILSGYGSAFCQEYNSSKGKPNVVLEGGECPKYKKG